MKDQNKTKAQLIVELEELRQNVSELEQLKDSLRYSEAKYRSLFERANDGIAIVQNGIVKLVNPRLAQMRGEPAENIIGKRLTKFIHSSEHAQIIDLYRRTLTGEETASVTETALTHMDGSQVLAELSTGSIAYEGKPADLVIVRDITERKRMEKELQDSETRFRSLIEQSPISTILYTPNGQPTYGNPATTKLWNMTPEQVQGVYQNYNIFEDQQLEEQGIMSEIRKGFAGEYSEAQPIMYDPKQTNPDYVGPPLWLQSYIYPVKDDGESIREIVLQHVDITQRIQIEDALKESHERLLTILDGIDADVYVSDLENHEILFMNQHMRESFGDNLVGQVCWQAFRGESEPCPHCTNDQLINSNGKPEGLITWEGHNPITKCWYINHDRAIEWVDGRVVRLQVATDITDHKQMQISLQEQTQDLQLVNEISQAINQEANFETVIKLIADRVKDLFELLSITILLVDKDENHLDTQYVNLPRPLLQKVLAIPGIDISQFKIPIDEKNPYVQALVHREVRIFQGKDEIMKFFLGFIKKLPFSISIQNQLEKIAPWIMKKSGIQSIVSVPLLHEDNPLGLLNIVLNRKIEETDLSRLKIIFEQLTTAIYRKLAEDALKISVEELARNQKLLLALSEAAQSVQQAKTPELVLQTIGEQIFSFGYNNAVFMLSDDRDYLELAHISYDPKLVRTAEKVAGVTARGYRFPIQKDSFYREVFSKAGAVIVDPASKAIKDALPKTLAPLTDKLAKILGVEKIIFGPLMINDNPIGLLAVVGSELTEVDVPAMAAFGNQAAIALENARHYREASQRLERLSSLRQIDQTISSIMDLKITLNILIGHLLRHLEVDAAAILLHQPEIYSLKFVTGHGFRTKALQFTNLRLGEGYAGLAALEQRIVKISDLNQIQTGFSRSPEFHEEKFVAYVGVPLIAKGNIIGVLEIYHRSPLNPDPEWMDFLETLAGQAAIAIDNIQLFDSLQSSNLQLHQAYDATIEGWAQALELRDMETKGHSNRVVKLTIELARKMGIEEKQLIHIRRGALLHDIGKLGISDAILKKPGKLNESDWEIVKQHPVYANEWLSPIKYLKSAVDIPYCHHEKWDGSGYPQGLQGEQIPLSARVFAVVDVWDALRSDRPYRKAWSQKKALAYLRDQSGKHFDSQVVEDFIELLKEKGLLSKFK